MDTRLLAEPTAPFMVIGPGVRFGTSERPSRLAVGQTVTPAHLCTQLPRGRVLGNLDARFWIFWPAEARYWLLRACPVILAGLDVVGAHRYAGNLML